VRWGNGTPPLVRKAAKGAVRDTGKVLKFNRGEASKGEPASLPQIPNMFELRVGSSKLSATATSLDKLMVKVSIPDLSLHRHASPGTVS
jgi:hypothetical protein